MAVSLRVPRTCTCLGENLANVYLKRVPEKGKNVYLLIIKMHSF